MSALLVANNIKKYYGSFAAVENVSLTVEKGTIHAIIGENGAGKSTLMNILAGVHEPTDGEIVLNGQVKRFKNATDAARSGIGMVQQEFMLFPELTVLENIILGHEPLKGRAFLNMGESEKRIRAICSDYGFRFDLHAPAGSLPIVPVSYTHLLCRGHGRKRPAGGGTGRDPRGGEAAAAGESAAGSAAPAFGAQA